MNRWLKALIILACLPLLSGFSGCTNIFEEASGKESDEAYEYEAAMLADRKDWTGAITAIGKMTPGAQARRNTQGTLASYYAGRCGLDLLGLAISVADGISANKLWPVLLSSMKGHNAADLADCQQAEQILLTIEPLASSRSSEENVLLAFIEFAKMGVIFSSSNADLDGDGALDAAFNACSTSDISDSAVQHLGTGLILGATSLTASGSTAAADAVSAVTVMCNAVDTFLGSSDFCDSTDPSDFTGVKLLALRSLIKSNEIGFNTCNGTIGQNNAGTAQDCLCPVIP